MDKKILLIGGAIITIGVAAILISKPNDKINNDENQLAAGFQCSDGLDNDGDGLIDKKDAGCHSDGDVNNQNSYDEKDDNESDNTLTAPTGNLRDFFSGKMGTDLVCRTTYKIAEDNELETAMYISGKRIRLDYEMQNPVPGMGGEMQKNLHMVSDGEYGYTWGESTLGGMMQGFKIKMDEMDVDSEETPEDLEQEQSIEMIDYEMPVTNCEPWTVDEKMFEIPEGINFIDPDNLGEIINKDLIPEESMEASCSLCSQLPANQISDCLSSLNCN